MSQSQKYNFSEKLATLVVDGVEREINSAVYGDNAVLVLTDAFRVSPSDFTGRGREPYRAALVVKDGSLMENMSVFPAISGGELTDAGLSHASIHSTTPNFNQVILEHSDFTISDSELKADTESDGKRVCDFDGYGAVISAHKGTKLKINNCHLFSRGVAKPVIFVDGGSDVLLKDSSYECMGGKLYAGYQNAAGFTKMVAPPWVLGITGTARGTNLMGELSTMTIVNCDCKANDWGVVSTDGGHEMTLYIVDSNLTLIGEGNMLDNPFVRRFGPGYGVYAAGCDEFFHGVEFNVGTYAIIAIGGTITLASSKGKIVPKKKYLVPTGKFAPMPPDGHKEEIKDVFWEDTPIFDPIMGKGRPTVVHSDGWGFMFHGDSSINLLDGTICETDFATFLIRSVNVNIKVDSSDLRSNDGVILQMIDNDDKAVGGLFTPDIYDDDGNLIQPHMGPIFNHEYFEHPGYPGIDYQPVCGSSGGAVNAEFTNCVLNGSFYNATGYRNVGDGDRPQGEVLNLTFGEGAVVTGVITAASAKHVDEKGRDNNTFTQEQYYYLGHVSNVPFYNKHNPVSVELKDDASWKVTGKCLLSALKIGDLASVQPADGKRLIMTLNGEPVQPKPGCSYNGDIELNIH